MKARQRKAILSNLARCIGATVESILSREHHVELVDNRSMIVAVMMEHAHMRQQDVAPLLDISQAAVSKLLTRHRQMMRHPGGNPDYQQRYADFKSTVESDDKRLPPAPLSEGEAHSDDKPLASGRHPSPRWRGAGGEVKKQLTQTIRINNQ